MTGDGVGREGVLRVYDPVECDERGVPLDWERCRCRDRNEEMWRDDPSAPPPPCTRCDDHGSLKAAALDHRHWMRTHGDHGGQAVRCEDCGHPMSEGTWEGLGKPGRRLLTAAQMSAVLAGGDERLRTWADGAGVCHYSPCDEGCRHEGVGVRWRDTGGEWHTADGMAEGTRVAWDEMEASWRPVDVRTLGWPHDLRPERLAVLCLRCFAERLAASSRARR